jgi:hypothetical protein
VAPNLRQWNLEGGNNNSKEVTADYREEEKGVAALNHQGAAPRGGPHHYTSKRGQPGEGRTLISARGISQKRVAPLDSNQIKVVAPYTITRREVIPPNQQVRKSQGGRTQQRFVEGGHSTKQQEKN